MRVFSAIVWKEAKGLQPFFIFMLVFFVVGLLSTQTLEFMDSKAFWDDTVGELHAFLIILLLILAFIGTLGILPREKEEGSLHFLEGLPIRRSTVYFAKWLMVFFIVSSYLILLFLEILFYERLSLASDSPATPWRHIFTFYLLCLFLCAFFTAILFPLSFLRLWSLLFIILYFIIVYILIAWQIPYASLLSPLELVQPPLDIESPWVIPWIRIIIYTLVGIVAYIFGLWLFCRIPATSIKPDKPFHKTVGGWITYLIAAGFGFILILGIISTNLIDQSEQNNSAGGASDIKSAKTQHFDFLYRDEMTDRLAPLIKDADSIYLQVASFLQAEEYSSRIVVDLTRPLASHNAGQAYWNKIRMSFPANYTLDEATAVFGHEVTHVVIDRISNRRLKSINSSRWFHEGLASYVEFTHFRKTNSGEKYQRWLALASTWDEVKFLDFIEPNNNSDTYLVYPAGFEAIHALVDVYGEQCLPKLLKAMDRKKAPKKINGMQFWTDTFLAAEYDLERVRTQFRKRLNGLEKEYQTICDQLPEITAGTATKTKSQLVITPELPKGWRKDAPKGARLVCRIRPSKNAQPFQWKYAKLSRNKTFLSDAYNFPNPNIGFQVGWVVKDWTPEAVYGEWIDVDLKQE